MTTAVDVMLDVTTKHGVPSASSDSVVEKEYLPPHCSITAQLSTLGSPAGCHRPTSPGASVIAASRQMSPLPPHQLLEENLTMLRNLWSPSWMKL